MKKPNRSVPKNDVGPAHGAQVSETVWRVASLIIILAAACLRLYDLTLKPFHHDEGVNGFFLTQLVRGGIYHYDPSNYHGPTLYFFALIPAQILGLTTTAVRLVPVFFGVATIWLLLSLRRWLGAVGALAAASFVAVSPGAVYLSRYFIHESQFVFFTLGIVVASLEFRQRAEWRFLMLASASASLLFATKETAIISAGVLLIALGSTAIYIRLRRRDAEGSSIDVMPSRKGAQRQSDAGKTSVFLERLGAQSTALWMCAAAIALFILIHVLFYSSFFTYAQGVTDSFAAFKVWAKTGKSEHTKVWYTYLQWLWRSETALLCLGSLGVILAFWRAESRFSVFAALWTVGIIAAYSLVPYKTPWLDLNFVIPLAIVAGYAINVISEAPWDAIRPRALALALAVVAVGIASYQMVVLNFYHYDDDAYIYPYAHTKREFLQLVAEINRLSRAAGTGTATPIAILSPDYWPLPWYLNDYKSVGFYGSVQSTDDPLVIGSETDESKLAAALGTKYRRVGSYPLRPGVTLILYARVAGQ